nr:unnamed protein product [Callosobruchus chinensis]
MLQQQHEAAIKKIAADRDRLKQLLDNEKRRSMDIKNKFNRDTKNLRKKSEQYGAALRKLNEKHDKKVAALKNAIKRLEVLDQLKKAESECVQIRDENPTLRQMVAQLEAEVMLPVILVILRNITARPVALETLFFPLYIIYLLLLYLTTRKFVQFLKKGKINVKNMFTLLLTC